MNKLNRVCDKEIRIQYPHAENPAQKSPGKRAVSGFKPGDFIVTAKYPLCNLLFEKIYDTVPLIAQLL